VLDPLSLTAAMLIAKAMEGAADEAGRSALGGLGRLLGVARREASDDPQVAQALIAVERSPSDQAAVRALAAVLDDRLRSDASLRSTLDGLVAESTRDPVTNAFVTHVSDEARVERITNIGHAGDVSL
jgi:hypothetical protein